MVTYGLGETVLHLHQPDLGWLCGRTVGIAETGRLPQDLDVCSQCISRLKMHFAHERLWAFRGTRSVLASGQVHSLAAWERRNGGLSATVEPEMAVVNACHEWTGKWTARVGVVFGERLPERFNPRHFEEILPGHETAERAAEAADRLMAQVQKEVWSFHLPVPTAVEVQDTVCFNLCGVDVNVTWEQPVSMLRLGLYFASHMRQADYLTEGVQERVCGGKEWRQFYAVPHLVGVIRSHGAVQVEVPRFRPHELIFTLKHDGTGASLLGLKEGIPPAVQAV